MTTYKEKIELFCEGALEALLWTEELEGYVVDPDSEERFREFCEKFFVMFECQWDALAAFEKDFSRYETYGHDFLLTWNGHAAGIWDRYMEYDDPYSRLTFDLLTVPLSLAIDEISWTPGIGKIEARVDSEDGPVMIDVPDLSDKSSYFSQRWLAGIMDEWQAKLPAFVLKHIEIPKPARKRTVKA